MSTKANNNVQMIGLAQGTNDSEHRVHMIGEHGMPMMGDHRVPRMGEHEYLGLESKDGVPRIGEQGVHEAILWQRRRGPAGQRSVMASGKTCRANRRQLHSSSRVSFVIGERENLSGKEFPKRFRNGALGG